MSATDKKSTKKFTGFSEEERAAIREYAQEKAGGKVDGESAVLAKIAKMSEPDRTLAKQFHALVKVNAPTLVPRTWYGMPAYGTKDGKVICFFQDAAKFKSRYATIGFSDKAKLDAGNMWQTAFAVKKLAKEDEATIAALVKKAVS